MYIFLYIYIYIYMTHTHAHTHTRTHTHTHTQYLDDVAVVSALALLVHSLRALQLPHRRYLVYLLSWVHKCKY
jgi:hypothetical protein